MLNDKVPCPCCGYLTLDCKDSEYDICPVCFWENDPSQSRYPDMAGGANRPSLNEAKQNYIKYGACEERLTKYVRNPLPEEKV